MIIQSPAVYLLPSSTTNCTLHSSKLFSIQLSLLIYTQQSHLFPEKHWMLNSLQQLHKYMHKGACESGFVSGWISAHKLTFQTRNTSKSIICSSNNMVVESELPKSVEGCEKKGGYHQYCAHLFLQTGRVHIISQKKKP